MKSATYPVFKENTMYTAPEQFSAAGKAGLDSFLSLAGTGFAGLEKLIALNIASTKSVFEESLASTQAMFAIKDPRELMSLQSSLAQPSLEKSIAYSTSVYGIVTETKEAFLKEAEAQSGAAYKEFTSALEKTLKSAPAGSESAVAAIKTAVANATAAYENVTKVAKQALSTAEASFANATKTAAANVTTLSKAVPKRK